MRSEPKPRVAWFSPLHCIDRNSASVSAYASDQLLPLLRDQYEIELFHQGFESYRDFPTFNYLSAFRRHREHPYDIIFYQLEDAKTSNFLRVHVGLMPGTVWFHDLVFSNFGPEPILNSPWRTIVQKFGGINLDWPERGDEFEQQGPLGFREAAWATVPIFSNPVALNEYRRNITLRLSQSVKESPLGYYLPLPVAGRVTEHRASGTFEIAFVGTPRIEHRAHKLLQALHELGEGHKLIWLLDRSEFPAAQSLLNEFSFPGVSLVEGRSPQRWRDLLSSADCAVHTHFSVYGQPEPYLGISLMAGLPCLVSRFGPTEYLPENIVFKIEAGSQEVFQISEVLKALRTGLAPGALSQVHQFAWDIRRTEVVAAELNRIFTAEAGRIKEFDAHWRRFEREAKMALLAEAKSLAADDDAWDRLMRPCFEEFGWL